jgi:hypothetical protein
LAEFSVESETKDTVSSIRDLFGFLSDFKNFPSILPADKVEDFKYSGDECSFNIKGITAMTVKMTEKKPYEHIYFSSEGLAKFNFKLHVFFIGNDPGSKGSCRVELIADLNPFIKMMAEKPLAQLVDTMVQKLAELKVDPAG